MTRFAGIPYLVSEIHGCLTPVSRLGCVNSQRLNFFAHDLQWVTSIGLVQRTRRIHWKNKSFRNAGSCALYWSTIAVFSILIDELANLDFSDPQFPPL